MSLIYVCFFQGLGAFLKTESWEVINFLQINYSEIRSYRISGGADLGRVSGWGVAVRPYPRPHQETVWP